MKAISITINKSLIKRIDFLIEQEIFTSRSDITRQAIRQFLQKQQQEEEFGIKDILTSLSMSNKEKVDSLLYELGLKENVVKINGKILKTKKLL
jgi:metal-responsive CopG/Arc/MetJ family transcriptional regulator